MIVVEIIGAALVGIIVGWYARGNTNAVAEVTKVETAVEAEVNKIEGKTSK